MPRSSRSYRGVLQHYEAAPERIRSYFPDFAELVTRHNWEVSISYVFSRIERAKRMTIYCGIMKLHWCESSLTWKLVSKDHLSRRRFRELFEIVFGQKIPNHLIEKLEKGERVRDKIAHGMTWTPAEAREGLTNVIDFTAEFNEFVAEHAGFRPFGDLRGYKGRKEPLTQDTTKWVLRGMGIPKREEN